MRRIGGSRWALMILVALTIVGVALTPLPTPTTDPGASSASFQEFMAPRLTALLASSQRVDELVSERSRNVLALRAESDRITALVDAIDTYLATAAIPGPAMVVVTDYEAGRDLILAAIDGANLALRSLDFSAIPGMIPDFRDGVELIERAQRALGELGDRGFVVHW